MEAEEIIVEMTEDSDDDKTKLVQPVQDSFAKVIAETAKPVLDAAEKIDATVKAYAATASEFTAQHTRSVTAPAGARPTKYSGKDPTIAQAWATLQVALKTAQNTLSQSTAAAELDLEKATDGWSLAQTTFTTAIHAARATLNSAARTAIKTYNEAANSDSKSRSCNLYFTLESAVATAVATYTSTANDAVTALASASADCVNAYAAFTAAWASAAALADEQETAAWQTYWAAVETELDAT